MVDTESHPSKLPGVSKTVMYNVALMRRGALSLIIVVNGKNVRLRLNKLQSNVPTITTPSMPKFRLVFLRADEFHAKKAAQRLVNHLEQKLAYFGSQALGRSL